ncbi:amino acid permease-domain-containing protein [Peziza echinospora]|nr:amino acid permease-domain-containing protein [Peziza echinospora]
MNAQNYGQPPTTTDGLFLRADKDEIGFQVEFVAAQDGSRTSKAPSDPSRAQAIDYAAAERRNQELKPSPRILFWDVVSLNLNSMIGIGIFTTPGAVLKLSRSKSVSIALWFAGGVYSLMSAYIYCEYSSHMPVNGGEFRWLDTVFASPLLLFAVTVGLYSLLLQSSVSNVLAFANHAYFLHDPKQETGYNTTVIHEHDMVNSDGVIYRSFNETTTRSIEPQRFPKEAIALIGIVVITAACLINFFSARAALLINRWFALGKVLFLMAVIIGGFIAVDQAALKREQWSGTADAQDIMAALVQITFSYTGWQTAFYVAGDVRPAAVEDGEDANIHKRKLLRLWVSSSEAERWNLRMGTLVSILIVTILYILTTLAYFLAVPLVDLIGNKSQNGIDIGWVFMKKAFGHSGPGTFAIALSAFGYLVAAAYAYSRVNQQVFRYRFLPFSDFLGRNHTYFETPTGGLFMHWLVTVVTTLISIRSDKGNDIFANIKSYGLIFLAFLLGLGIFVMWMRTQPSPAWRNEHPSKMVTVLGILLLLSSIFILVTSAIGYDADYARNNRPKSLAVSFAIFFLYWLVLYSWIHNWFRRKDGIPIGEEEVGKKEKSTIVVYVYTPGLDAQTGGPLSDDAIADPVAPGGVPLRPTADIRAVKPALLYTTRQDRAIGEMLEERNREWGDTKLIVYTWSKSTQRLIDNMYKFFAKFRDNSKRNRMATTASRVEIRNHDANGPADVEATAAGGAPAAVGNNTCAHCGGRDFLDTGAPRELGVHHDRGQLVHQLHGMDAPPQVYIIDGASNGASSSSGSGSGSRFAYAG